MIFYLLGLLSYYKLAGKPVPVGICLLFFGVVTIPPATTLYVLLSKHWIFEVLAFACGLFCWTFIEYFMHRFLMHAKEKKGYHNGHHFHHHRTGIIFTTTLKRIIFLSVAVVSIWAGVFISSYLLLPSGIIMGLTLYSFMHLWLHKPWAEKWLSSLQQFHMQHHFGQTEKCFGVTTTLWDRVFNTNYKNEIGGNEMKRNLFFMKFSSKHTIKKTA
jgi:sterol desaturase/sphingolipid hydroxylase (fatty acid hydroxylase superfamily)